LSSRSTARDLALALRDVNRHRIVREVLCIPRWIA